MVSPNETGSDFVNKARMLDCTDALEIGEAMADYLVEKVAEIQYNKVIDAKKKPYVVLHTTLQSLTCVETLEMKPDWKRDDYLLTDMHREMDHEEPLPLGRDCMQTEPESKQRP